MKSEPVGGGAGRETVKHVLGMEPENVCRQMVRNCLAGHYGQPITADECVTLMLEFNKWLVSTNETYQGLVLDKINTSLPAPIIIGPGEPVGASLSAQTPPIGELTMTKRECGHVLSSNCERCGICLVCCHGHSDQPTLESLMRDLALRGISFDAEIALDGEDATPWESASEPEPQHFATFLEAYDFQIKIASGAAPEGDCPCGATVVRKSDSANKSKLCADCAAQEEAPGPDPVSKVVFALFHAKVMAPSASHERVLAIVRRALSGVVAEEEAGAPTGDDPK